MSQKLYMLFIAPSHPPVSIQPAKQTIVDTDTSAAYLTIDLDTDLGSRYWTLIEIYSSNDNWLSIFLELSFHQLLVTEQQDSTLIQVLV